MNDLTLLLDRSAGINLSSNQQLLKDVKANQKKKLNVTGVMCEKSTSDALGSLPLPSGEYYLNNTSKAVGNILSLALLTDDYTVKIYSSVSNAFYIYNHNGDYLKFSRCRFSNMYRLDIREAEEAQVEVNNLVTVNDNKDEYSILEYQQAEKVRDLQHLLGCPGDFDLAYTII